MYIYTTLLRPTLVRKLTHILLRKMIKEEIILPEGALLLNKNDPVVSGALSMGVYEAFFAAEFRRRVQGIATVVDIGANLGFYTLIASKHATKVIAFEPEAENAALLSKTVARNNLKNITLVQKGLGDKNEALTLAIHPDNKGKHTLLGIDEKGVTSVTIPVTTLDAELLAHNILSVDMIKIDIEGWEAKALRGAKETIHASHPTIMFEFAPQRIRAAGDDPLLMLHELEDEGYTLFVIDEDHDTLMPLDPTKLIATLTKNDAYTNILAEPRAP